MKNWVFLAVAASILISVLGCWSVPAQPNPEPVPDGETAEKLAEKGRDAISSFKDRLKPDKPKATTPSGPTKAESSTSTPPDNSSSGFATSEPAALSSTPALSPKAGSITAATATPESKLGITLPGSSISGGLPGQPNIITPTPTSRARSGSSKKQTSDGAPGSTLTSGKSSKRTMVETAISLQQHTEWVSQDHKEIDGILDDNGWNLVGDVMRGGTVLSGSQAYVATKGDKIVVAFRGTDSDNPLEKLSNSLTDVRATVTKLDFIDDSVRYADVYQEIKVHKGFHNEYEAMRDTIFKYVNRHPDKDLFVTGHSLGAALGILCAFDLAVHSDREATGYFSGSPRVGGVDFRKAFEAAVPASYRIVVNKDPIPQAPGIVAKYKHVGYLRQLYPNGVVVPSGKIDPATTYKELAEAVTYFSRHDRSEYAEALEGHLANCKSDLDKCPTLSDMSTAAKAERKAAAE